MGHAAKLLEPAAQAKPGGAAQLGNDARALAEKEAVASVEGVPDGVVEPDAEASLEADPAVVGVDESEARGDAEALMLLDLTALTEADGLAVARLHATTRMRCSLFPATITLPAASSASPVG
jgi:hypothetical protein